MLNASIALLPFRPKKFQSKSCLPWAPADKLIYRVLDNLLDRSVETFVVLDRDYRPETVVNQVLRDWQCRKLVRIDKGRIAFLDRAALAHMCEDAR